MVGVRPITSRCGAPPAWVVTYTVPPLGVGILDGVLHPSRSRTFATGAAGDGTGPGTRAFYQLAWCLGGSQSDLACLLAEDVDWANHTISYSRKKTGAPALLRFGPEMVEILKARPAQGPLFPRLAEVHEKHRAKQFRRRCLQLGIKGVSLRSYRYAWAERAWVCGYPERFAQEALGHNSKAVHRAYARRAQVKVPSLEEYERRQQPQNVVPLTTSPACAPTQATPGSVSSPDNGGAASMETPLATG